MSLTDTRTDQLPASPRATRHSVVRWRDPRLLVGVVILAASALTGALLVSGDETVPVWAAEESLSAGQLLGAGDLVRRQVRFTDQAGADRYLSADQPPPAGVTLARDVGRGELLPRSALDAKASAPVVEVPLTVAAESVPETVRPGSVVDVWVTASVETAAASDPDAPARLVLADVRVLAVTSEGTALGVSAARQVIVGLDRGQDDELAEVLAEMARGSVVLVRKP